MKGLTGQQETPNGALRKVVPGVSPEVKINNQDSDFYTIVEIVGEDRMGILHELTQAMTDHGCDIHFSRISTLGNRIIDVFYVQDNLGEKIEGKDEMASLRQTLLNCLSSKEPHPFSPQSFLIDHLSFPSLVFFIYECVIYRSRIQRGLHHETKTFRISRDASLAGARVGLVRRG